MVRVLEAKDSPVTDPAVLAAMRAVPRHWFVPDRVRPWAYADRSLPVGEDQTISQPYIVALMTQLARIEPGMRVLEIGTGSGYAAAVLYEITPAVYTIEIVPALAKRAVSTFERHGYEGIRVRLGDGYAGWPEHAPFDRILVTAAPPEIPPRLVEQLSPGGRMVLPVGRQDRGQDLMVVMKHADGSVETRRILGVRFVPMVHGEPGSEDPR